MEAFEQVVKVALEAEGFVASPGVKFFVARRTKKKGHREVQRHGYEVDLVAARNDKLVLASVKSYFGSKGVTKVQVQKGKGYHLFNVKKVREGVVQEAANRFGYRKAQIELRLYVGHFARGAEAEVTKYLSGKKRPVKVVGCGEVVKALVKASESKTYLNETAIVTVKALREAGQLASTTKIVAQLQTPEPRTGPKRKPKRPAQRK